MTGKKQHGNHAAHASRSPTAPQPAPRVRWLASLLCPPSDCAPGRTLVLRQHCCATGLWPPPTSINMLKAKSQPLGLHSTSKHRMIHPMSTSPIHPTLHLSPATRLTLWLKDHPPPPVCKLENYRWHAVAAAALRSQWHGSSHLPVFTPTSGVCWQQHLALRPLQHLPARLATPHDASPPSSPNDSSAYATKQIIRTCAHMHPCSSANAGSLPKSGTGQAGCTRRGAGHSMQPQPSRPARSNSCRAVVHERVYVATECSNMQCCTRPAARQPITMQSVIVVLQQFS